MEYSWKTNYNIEFQYVLNPTGINYNLSFANGFISAKDYKNEVNDSFKNVIIKNFHTEFYILVI